MSNQKIETLITEHSEKQTKLQKFLHSLNTLDEIIKSIDQQKQELNQDNEIILNCISSIFEEKYRETRASIGAAIIEILHNQNNLKVKLAENISAICTD